MEIHKLTTSGPAAAALLQEGAVAQGAFDGLLIGSTLVRTESVLHDTRDETKQELLEVHISAFCCCSGLGSFYNAAGDVEAEEVSSIAQAFEGSFLGWFVYHDGPHRAPTIRERAVTAALAQLVPPDVPVLFALMSSTLDSDRATAGFEQQFLEQEPGTVLLRPVEIHIENIGSSKRARHYQPLRPIAGIAPVLEGSLVRSSSGNKAGDRQASVSGDLVLTSQRQTANLEGVYKEMLGSLREATQLYASEQVDLKALQHEVDMLALSVGI